MQRIEEKRIDNSSLVPSRIAEQKTTWRQPNNIGLNLSGFDRAVNSLGRLADSVSREFEKADREMDELAQIKANALFSAEQQAAFNKLDGMPLTEIGNNLDKIRGDFAANVRKKLEAIPMTDRMREVVNANLLGADEIMKVKLESQLKRKQANYIIGEHSDMLKNALESGDTAVALAENKKLAELGVKTKYSEADIKSNGVFVNLRQAFDLNDFEYLDKLSANKDGKYTHFKELKHDDRIRLIDYGKEKQHKLQNDNYNKYLVKNANGEDFTISDIKDMYAKKGLTDSGYTALIKGKQIQNYENIVYELGNIESGENFDDQISGYSEIVQSEYDAGNISEKQYNELNSVFKSAAKKEKINQIQQQIANNKKRNEEIKNGFMGMVQSNQIPLNPTDNAIKKQVALNQAAKVFGSDLNLLNSVNNEIEKIYADGLKGKGIFETPEGAIVRNYLNSNFRTKDGKFNRDLLKYDPWGPRKYDSQEFMSERYYMLVDHAVFCLKNGMSAPQIREELEKKNKEFGDNETKIIFSKIEERNSFKDKMIIFGDTK